MQALGNTFFCLIMMPLSNRLNVIRIFVVNIFMIRAGFGSFIKEFVVVIIKRTFFIETESLKK